ncbi:PTS fructose transporter subunit IIA [Uliginosibacterium flavum]|uniref:PTS fructose transporter subunit IIA n=1 Tax=Uliginosibacterium flavum TaxID=1396831 RepID=A0ABV2TGF2_9RHOO
MIGLLIITHGALGESLIQCICHVINKRPLHIAQLGVAAQDEPNEVLDEAHRLLTSVDDGEGVLVLTDIYGATPSNIAMKLLVPGKIEGVAGVSVPMLLRVLTYREKSDIQTVVQKAISGACDGVLHIKGRS